MMARTRKGRLPLGGPNPQAGRPPRRVAGGRLSAPGSWLDYLPRINATCAGTSADTTRSYGECLPWRSWWIGLLLISRGRRNLSSSTTP